MAPGAALLYVGAATARRRPQRGLNDVVAHHRADIVTNSYSNAGEDVPAAEVAAFDRIAEQAALEGIGCTSRAGTRRRGRVLGRPTPTSRRARRCDGGGRHDLGIDARGHTVIERGWETGPRPHSAPLGTPVSRRVPLRLGRWRVPPLRGAGLQRAVVPDALADAVRRAVGSCPMSPWTAIPTPACSSVRRSRGATACTSTCTGSAARACRARCSPG